MTDGEPRVRPRRTSPVDRTANFLRGRIEGDLLTRALVDLAAVGQRPHCSDPGTRDLWLSEHDGERAQAALLCHGCPVFAPCGTAAAARQETWGRWAGRDFSRKPRATSGGFATQTRCRRGRSADADTARHRLRPTRRRPSTSLRTFKLRRSCGWDLRRAPVPREPCGRVWLTLVRDLATGDMTGEQPRPGSSSDKLSWTPKSHRSSDSRSFRQPIPRKRKE